MSSKKKFNKIRSHPSKKKPKNKNKKKTLMYKDRRRVIFERSHFRAEWSWDKRRECWYITVLDTDNPDIHRHYSEEKKNFAVSIVRHCADSIVPGHYSEHEKINLRYLILGGEKPEKKIV